MVFWFWGYNYVFFFWICYFGMQFCVEFIWGVVFVIKLEVFCCGYGEGVVQGVYDLVVGEIKIIGYVFVGVKVNWFELMDVSFFVLVGIGVVKLEVYDVMVGMVLYFYIMVMGFDLCYVVSCVDDIVEVLQVGGFNLQVGDLLYFWLVEMMGIVICIVFMMVCWWWVFK